MLTIQEFEEYDKISTAFYQYRGGFYERMINMTKELQKRLLSIDGIDPRAYTGRNLRWLLCTEFEFDGEQLAIQDWDYDNGYESIYFIDFINFREDRWDNYCNDLYAKIADEVRQRKEKQAATDAANKAAEIAKLEAKLAELKGQ